MEKNTKTPATKGWAVVTVMALFGAAAITASVLRNRRRETSESWLDQCDMIGERINNRIESLKAVS